jgi:hypothetical protein
LVLDVRPVDTTLRARAEPQDAQGSLTASSQTRLNFMAIGKKPKSTGPKTVAGKAKASMNALSHGLTSTRVMPDEIRMVEEFTQELIAYYKPDSPLEVLQIQRIAFCRAKLARLIDIEWANRELTRKKIQTEPEMVMAKLTQYPESLRAVALDQIKGRSFLSQFGLDESTLEALVLEIDAPMVLLESPSDLFNYYPKVCSFLEGVFREKFDLGIIDVDQMLEMYAQNILHRLKSSSQAKDASSELQRLFENMLTEQALEERAQRKQSRQTSSKFLGYNQLVTKDLQAITDLNNMMVQVRGIIKNFEQMKEWMIRSVDLQSDESERMMKYQTMLERRLSTSIGELFEIRKIKNNI